MSQPETWVEVTKILLITTALVLTVYDSIVMAWLGRQPTITDVVYHYACQWPIIPLLVGMIIGHIFWR